jgi:hypothetical protein
MAMLAAAIPQLPMLSSFYISCPFWPPDSIFSALAQCTNCSSLTLDETPIGPYPLRLPASSLPLKHLSIVTVGQALRVGDGPFNPKYSDVTYYTREWRKKYHQPHRATPVYQSHATFTWTNSSSLTHFEVSGSLYSFEEMAQHDWPNLRTFILTGLVPDRREFTIHAWGREFNLVDVLTRMPKLQDLRLLFSQSKSARFHVMRPEYFRLHSSFIFSSLKSLAISNTCIVDGVFERIPFLERLAVIAIINHPRVPIALSLAETEDLLIKLGSKGGRLSHLRIMIEEKLSPHVCQAIATYCPNLEVLEVEQCGYHDGKSNYTWVSYLIPISQSLHTDICLVEGVCGGFCASLPPPVSSSLYTVPRIR